MMTQDRRALITGAAGFVGRYLRDQLLAHDWQVICTDVNVPPDSAWRSCDIADATDVAALAKWAGAVTHVFHLAAITYVPEAGRNPIQTFDINLQGTLHLLDAFRTSAPTTRFIYISSAEVYGPPRSLPMTEEHPLHPGNPYAISKAAADQYCGWAHTVLGADIIRIRPFNHTGAGQSAQFALSSFARQIACIEAGKQEPLVRVGNLDPARDFSHVLDVVRAYELAALHGTSGAVYNVCSGESVSIGHALECLLALSRVRIRVESDPERIRPAEVKEVRGSHEKLTTETGWTPEVSFNQLLNDLLAYWRRRETV